MIIWKTGVLDPQGPIAAAERTLLANATVIMLAVVVPVILATLAFAWWFREGNPRARRQQHWTYSGPIEITVWSIPLLVVMFLGGIAWIGSHQLDPRQAIDSPSPPLDVQVVSLDWKWLFVYPGEGIATVNRLVVPVGTPLRLQLTSASVMNSFFVPQLGSQIYTMPRMTTMLYLQADKAGTYPGISAQFSGDGFSDMRFEVQALSQPDFKRWQAATHAGQEKLDAARYAVLAEPRSVAGPLAFSTVAPGLFKAIAQGAAPAGSSAAPASPGGH